MTSRSDCSSAERLAGAIAVGDASEAEREAYRGHVATCAHCLNEFGGEREIERVMSVVARARDDERWDPDLRARIARGPAARRAWVWALSVAAVAALAIGIHNFEKPRPPAIVHSISPQDARALAALGTQTAVPREGRAESLAVGARTLSTSFEVNVDQRGVAVRCTITKSSGVRTLDASVCRTALRARYTP